MSSENTATVLREQVVSVREMLVTQWAQGFTLHSVAHAGSLPGCGAHSACVPVGGVFRPTVGNGEPHGEAVTLGCPAGCGGLS